MNKTISMTKKVVMVKKKGDSFNLHRSTAPWSIYMSFFYSKHIAHKYNVKCWEMLGHDQTHTL